MKAIRVHEFGGPEVMRLEEVPDLAPGPGEVVVRVRAAGVNPVDTYIRSGAYALPRPLPYTPGQDAAGTVEAVGENVPFRRRGERVYIAGSLSGTYAEQVLCRADQVHPLPERLSFAQGAGVNTPFGTAWYALFQRGKAMAGEFVLVHGASGGVGSAAVQLARAAGLRVIGTAGSDRGRSLAAELGAHEVLDHTRPGYLEAIPGLTCGHGVDLVLEMLANVNLGRDLKILAKGGRVVVVGSRGKVEIDPRDTMSRNAAVLGLLMANATDRERYHLHAALGAGLENGTLTPVVGQELPLAEAPAAHQAVLAPGSYGKIALIA